MNETTVSAALPQREPGAQFKTVGELQRYDWVAAKELDDNYAAEILHVEPYDDGEHAAIILFSSPTSTEPLIAALDTSGSMQLATEKEIEEARETRRREAVCARLTQLADLIRDRELPIGERFETIRVSIRVADMAELDEVANVIGTARESSGPMSTVTWPATPPGLGSSPVEAMWHAYAPSIVADPLGRGFGRNEVAEPVFVTGEVPDYVRGVTADVRAPGEAFGVVHEAEQDRERAIGTAPVSEHYEKSEVMQ